MKKKALCGLQLHGADEQKKKKRRGRRQEKAECQAKAQDECGGNQRRSLY